MYRRPEDAALARADAALARWRFAAERLDRAYRRHDVVAPRLVPEPVPEAADAVAVAAVAERVEREAADLGALAERVERTPIRGAPFGSGAALVVVLVIAWATTLVAFYLLRDRSPLPWLAVASAQAALLTLLGKVLLAKSHVPRLKKYVPAAARRAAA